MKKIFRQSVEKLEQNTKINSERSSVLARDYAYLYFLFGIPSDAEKGSVYSSEVMKDQEIFNKPVSRGLTAFYFPVINC